MSRDEFFAKYKDPRWQKMRLEVLNRDGFKCQMCGSAEKTLHVHHLSYSGIDNPWDIHPNLLITLCVECHEVETEARRQAETTLLRSLRRFGAHSQTLTYLAMAFDSLRSQYATPHTAGEAGALFGALRALISDKSRVAALIGEYMEKSGE